MPKSGKDKEDKVEGATADEQASAEEGGQATAGEPGISLASQETRRYPQAIPQKRVFEDPASEEPTVAEPSTNPVPSKDYKLQKGEADDTLVVVTPLPGAHVAEGGKRFTRTAPYRHMREFQCTIRRARDLDVEILYPVNRPNRSDADMKDEVSGTM